MLDNNIINLRYQKQIKLARYNKKTEEMATQGFRTRPRQIVQCLALKYN